jgi:hypothetical protein
MSENTAHDVANRLLASPGKSLRVLSQEIGLSRSTCQRAAKKASLHAYRFTVVQGLKQRARRIAVGSRHSVMRIREYWTTHRLATRRGFTYLVM